MTRKLLTISTAVVTALLLAASAAAQAPKLTLNDLGYFEARGTNVLVYNNLYNGGFYDEKFAGLEIIQRGERLATGGGIRLMNTPEQWDIFGVVSPREIDRAESSVAVSLTYADYDFSPRLKVLPKDKGVLVTRLAHGLPMGAALDYADDLTLIKALDNRRKIDHE